jgi:hypothetical protein
MQAYQLYYDAACGDISAIGIGATTPCTQGLTHPDISGGGCSSRATDVACGILEQIWPLSPGTLIGQWRQWCGARCSCGTSCGCSSRSASSARPAFSACAPWSR